MVAFCIRLALAVARVRTNWFVTHGIPVYAGWAFNIAEFGRFDFVEGSMASQLYAAMAPLERFS